MSDEPKDFSYYADKAEEYITDAVNHVDQVYNPSIRQTALAVAAVYAGLAKAAPKAESTAPTRCSEWISQGIRDLPSGFVDYRCVLFAGHGTEHESSTGQYWIAEVRTSA